MSLPPPDNAIIETDDKGNTKMTSNDLHGNVRKTTPYRSPHVIITDSANTGNIESISPIHKEQ